MYALAQINEASRDWLKIKNGFLDIHSNTVKSVFNRFEKLEILSSNMYEVYLSWGYILAELADKTKDVAIYRQSIEKFSSADVINPFTFAINHAWGVNLLMLGELEENNSYNLQAFEKLENAERIQPENVYNLACAYIRQGQIEEAKNRLVICKENYTLPSKELLLKDADMNVFHDTPWFEELIASLG